MILTDYKKYAGQTKTKVDFTMFDKNYIIALGNKISMLETSTVELIKHIKELDNRLKEVEK